MRCCIFSLCIIYIFAILKKKTLYRQYKHGEIVSINIEHICFDFNNAARICYLNSSSKPTTTILYKQFASV